MKDSGGAKRMCGGSECWWLDTESLFERVIEVGCWNDCGMQDAFWRKEDVGRPRGIHLCNLDHKDLSRVNERNLHNGREVALSGFVPKKDWVKALCVFT